MMSENHICAAAKAMAQTYTTASVPLYGKKLRLPDRQAVILLIKEIRRLIFPAYYGEAALMSLAPEDYAALLLERIEKQLFSQIAQLFALDNQAVFFPRYDRFRIDARSNNQPMLRNVIQFFFLFFNRVIIAQLF